MSVVRKGRRVVVRVKDAGGRNHASGPLDSGTTIDWGDGETADAVTRGASHRYVAAGSYAVVVRATDTAGNATAVRRRFVLAPTAAEKRAAARKRREDAKEARS